MQVYIYHRDEPEVRMVVAHACSEKVARHILEAYQNAEFWSAERKKGFRIVLTFDRSAKCAEYETRRLSELQ